MTANPTTAHRPGARRSTASRVSRRPAPGRCTARPTFLHPSLPAAPAPDWPARVVLALVFLAAVAMLSLPQARAASATFGWLPLWLAGLPATAWLALAAARRHAAGA